jgi:small subunit ribosomal protein S1
VDERGELTHKVGDEITAQVVALEGEGLRLSRGALKAREVSLMLEEAAAARIPVEGKVVGHNQGGLEIRLGGRRAFCPRSQVDRDFSEDLESHVGNTYRFIVTRYDPTGRKLVVSRRMVQEQEAKVLAAETRELLAVGAVVDGTVRKVMTETSSPRERRYRFQNHPAFPDRVIERSLGTHGLGPATGFDHRKFGT